MKKLCLSICLFIGTMHINGQYCTLGGPSSNADSNVESVILNGVSGGINHIGCPSQIGVELYLNESTTLSAGSSYSLQVDFGTCGGNYAGVGAVWIDFDQSQTFTQNEIVGTWVGTPPALPVLFNVSVPNNAHNGATRMRVTQQEAGTLPLNPCGAFQWGSVMDFGITIINGLDCGAFAGDDLANAIEVPSLPYQDTVDLAYCYGNQNLVYDSPDVFYKLLLNPTMQQVSVNTCGSDFDTYLTVLSPQGVVITYNDDHELCAPSSMLSFDVIVFARCLDVLQLAHETPLSEPKYHPHLHRHLRRCRCFLTVRVPSSPDEDAQSPPADATPGSQYQTRDVHFQRLHLT